MMNEVLTEKKTNSGTHWAKFLLLSFVVGAIAGTTGDFVHVITRTDGYPADGPFPFLPLLPVKMPVWVPFLFGTAVLLMGTSHKIMQKLFHPRMEKNFGVTASAPVLFVILYAMTGFLHTGTGSWEDVWLATATILIWWLMDRTFMGAGIALVNAVFGTAFEIFLVHVHGFFYYPEHANFYGVPSWLPWLYMAASVCVSLFVRLI
jgi:hypothetical protein